ncbi:hypothetical protein JK358_02030 [Nocardia sp. 2]|uniref:Uncharacterized protein n=1 Tax=Nocardia acididurans TaxID=2802282 RepID=A0ABS1LXS0_9NOCA|nr:SCO2524 family protein [Nocardia acididurans]MBL1073167.1 hypothetical protein [Nocardia acididurans]
MRIQPREQILGVWRSMLTACYQGGEWKWGGTAGSNSISDAEQLLCLLYPSTEIDGFGLADPDNMAKDIREVLAALGDRPVRITTAVLGLIDDYLTRYTESVEIDGVKQDIPVFSAGSYFTGMEDAEPTAVQRRLDVVDSYSMSLTLCLSALKFLRSLDIFTTKQPIRQLVARKEGLVERVSSRLTAAMVGLVRSFVVNTVKPESDSGRAMLSMLNQTGTPNATVVDAVLTRLDRVRTRLLNDVTLSQTPGVKLEDEGMLFECGWSWGLVRGGAPIEFVELPIASGPGFAVARPYLYFTVVALDGINDLTSVRTRELDLLNPQQRRLAEALQLRWDLAQRYWSAVARFGPGRWPLEDIPWRTSDGEESEYFSLIVSAALIQDLLNREANDDDLNRAAPIFDELARRGRITRRLTVNDPARAMHTPGVALRLFGSEDADPGPLLVWTVSDYATVLLKRSLQAARVSDTMETRDQLMRLAEDAMEHLDQRAFRIGPATGLWDDPSRLFGGPDRREPSWYLTERVVECLVAAAGMYREPPLRSPSLVQRAMELLTEAEHLLNRELLESGLELVSPNRARLSRAVQRLERARQLIEERPGTALSLTTQTLLELDELDYARSDATRGGM